MAITVQLTQLQPLCALLMLRMTDAQLLRVLSARHRSRRRANNDEPPTECSDMLASLDFTALLEGTATTAGNQRLAHHIGTCERCTMLFVLLLHDVQRQRPTIQGDSMSDFDDKAERTSPGRADPSVAFRQAMTGVQARCAQMARSIDNHDFENAEYMARNASNFWLAGRVACRRLVASRNGASPYIDAARQLLEANYMRLMELLVRAAQTIEVPRLHGALAEIRDTLVAAMAQPLNEDKETAETARPSTGTARPSTGARAKASITS